MTSRRILSWILVALALRPMPSGAQFELKSPGPPYLVPSTGVNDTLGIDVDVSAALSMPSVCSPKQRVIATRGRVGPPSQHPVLSWTVDAETEATANPHIRRYIAPRDATAYRPSFGLFRIDPSFGTDVHGEPVQASGRSGRAWEDVVVGFDAKRDVHVVYRVSLDCFIESGAKVLRTIIDTLSRNLIE
jgi:hypothetical protein